MRGPKPMSIELSERQKSILEQLARRHSSPEQQIRRVKLILSMAEGKNNQQTAQALDIHRETVGKWRTRWLGSVARLTAAEVTRVSDKELQAMIEEVLRDEARTGAPVTFSAEQLTHIIAIACEEPQASGRPISHWSGREIADEAIKRGIALRISPRTVERFLKRSRFKAAHKSLLAQC